MKGIYELVTEREDLFGIPEGHATGLGQRKSPPLSREELDAENLFQPMYLTTDGRMSQMELAAGSNDASLLGHDPEIKEVVVVEPLHLGSLARSANRTPE
jgi:hypothetical protein